MSDATADRPRPRRHDRAGEPPALAQRAPVVALVVLAVLARADRLPPPGVVAVPGDGLLQALLEADLRRPAQRAGLLGAQRVAAGGGRGGGGRLPQRTR